MFGAPFVPVERMGALVTYQGGSLPSAPFFHLEGAGGGVLISLHHASTV
jgi:hypothetical protein